jgi:hypothetical protein
MNSNIDDEARTSPLAFWRYAHDHLRIARELSRKHRIPCIDSQVAYHVGGQGVEFALKSFLRSRGMTVARMRAEIGHSLLKALGHCEAQGLPLLPPGRRAAIVQVAAYHQDTHFLYRLAPEGEFPEIDPVVDAGVYILDCIAPEVAEHFVVNHGGTATPTVEAFVGRLRADLSATAGDPAHDALEERGHAASHAGTRPYLSSNRTMSSSPR